MPQPTAVEGRGCLCTILPQTWRTRSARDGQVIQAQVRRGPGRKVRGRGQVAPLGQRFAMGALVANEVSDSGAPQEPSCANPTGGMVSFSCGLLVLSLLRSSLQQLDFGKLLPWPWLLTSLPSWSPSWSCKPLFTPLSVHLFLFFWFMFLCFLLIFLSFCRRLRPCP